MAVSVIHLLAALFLITGGNAQQQDSYLHDPSNVHNRE